MEFTALWRFLPVCFALFIASRCEGQIFVVFGHFVSPKELLYLVFTAFLLRDTYF